MAVKSFITLDNFSRKVYLHAYARWWNIQFIILRVQILPRDKMVKKYLKVKSLCPYVCLSICPSVHLSVCPSVRLSVCPSVCLSVCLSTCPPVHLSVCPSVRLSVYPSVCLSICLSFCLSVCLSVRLSVSLSVCIYKNIFDLNMFYCAFQNGISALIGQKIQTIPRFKGIKQVLI